jgi:hypothetical protein
MEESVMKQQNITAAGDWTKKQYRLVDRFLPLSGAPLEWPLLLTIIRRVAPQKKSVAELTREALLKEYAPAGVLVDHLGNICYVHGHTGLFLEPAQGYYGLSNVLKMARKKLRRDLNTTLYKAVTTQLAGESPLLSVKRNGETINLKIRVVPLLKKASMDQDFYLIIFDQRPDQKAQPVLTDSIAESINPLPVNRELMRINHVIETKEMELLTLCEKVDESKDALQILSAELFDARSELEANQPVAEIITPELNPVREELATLKNEFILMNQTLDDKKEVLGKLDATPNTTADWPLAVDLKAVGEPEKELLFNNAAEFQAAANHGYRHDNEIKSVHIPEGVEVVKRSMFYKCTQLETVTFPSTLKAIEDFAFYGCEALKQIDLNRCKVLEVIGTSAFEGCKSMAGLVIPDAVIAIEEAAFLGCQGLETVEFPGDSQLEVLGSHAFKDCEKIKSIILPEQLKHIGISCFYSCKKLFEIHLPRELETVGEYAFFGCNALEKINLPNKKIVKQPGFSIGFPEGVKI